MTDFSWSYGSRVASNKKQEKIRILYTKFLYTSNELYRVNGYGEYPFFTLSLSPDVYEFITQLEQYNFITNTIGRFRVRIDHNQSRTAIISHPKYKSIRSIAVLGLENH